MEDAYTAARGQAQKLAGQTLTVMGARSCDGTPYIRLGTSGSSKEYRVPPQHTWLSSCTEGSKLKLSLNDNPSGNTDTVLSHLHIATA